MENVLLKECINILNLKTIFTEKIAEKIFHDFEKKLIFSNFVHADYTNWVFLTIFLRSFFEKSNQFLQIFSVFP